MRNFLVVYETYVKNMAVMHTVTIRAQYFEQALIRAIYEYEQLVRGSVLSVIDTRYGEKDVQFVIVWDK